MIEVEALVKDYAGLRAVDHVTFHVEKGEILGFLGPNGAGKTTTMRILVGSLGATAGHARIGGFDIEEQPREAKELLGYMPEHVPVYRDMRVDDYLRFAAGLRGVDRRQRTQAAGRAAELASLDGLERRLISTLSRGQRQRVGLAQALVHQPPVIVLDEPTAGLDPAQIAAVRETIQNLRGDHTVILSTHILPEVSRTCDRAVIISHGRVVADDPIEQLERRARGSRQVELLVDEPEGLADKLRGLASCGGVRATKLEDGTTRLEVEVDGDVDLRRACAREAAPHGLVELREERASLEDVFLELVQVEAHTEAELVEEET